MVTHSMKEEGLPQIERSPWTDNLFRPALITVMVMCLNISIVNLVRLINPAWRSLYFLLGMLLITVEAIYSVRLLTVRRVRGSDLLRYRLAEWLLLILGLKLLSFANKPLARIWAELQLIWQDPTHFINLEYYVLLCLAALIWLAVTHTVADFEDLHDPYSFFSDRIVPLDSLAIRFFWGGGLLVLISGLTVWLAQEAGLASLLELRRPSLGGVILNVLVYFMLGLVLLSQAHLTTLLMRWQIQRIKVTSELTGRWVRYGLIALGLVTLVVFTLPTGYSLGFLTSAGLVIGLILNIIVFLVELLLLLLSLPLLWLLSLLGQPVAPPVERAAQPLFNPDNLGGGAGLPWLEALRSLLFWLIVGAMAWYLVRAYLSDQPGLLPELKRLRLPAFLLKLWGSLWGWLANLARTGWDMIPKQVNLAGSKAGQRGRFNYRRWAGLGSLTPRERILYYYLNVLERARQRGPVRRRHQTPYEFEPELSQAVPEAEQEIHILTQAFVQARYSPEEFFDDSQAGLARVLWQRIRQALSAGGGKPND